MVADALVAPNANAAHRLADLLDAAGQPVSAAVWVLNADNDSWRLWLATGRETVDRLEFYDRVARVVSRHRDRFPGFDVGDVELVRDDHPALIGLRRIMTVSGDDTARVTRAVVNGFFLSDAIIARLL